MKLKIFIILVGLFNFAYSQNNIAEYEFFHYDEKQYSEYLAFNQEESYFFIHGGAFDKADKTDYSTVSKNFNLKKFSASVVNKNNKTYSRFSFPANVFYAMEDIPEIKWQITDEHKEILGYNARKAVTEFRGRKYTAWFTMEIISHYGPWKLNGLPGLILEVSDSNSAYKYLIKSLNLNTNLWIPENAIAYVDNELKKAIPFKDAVTLENDKLQNNLNKIMASFPAGTSFKASPLRSEMKEVSFEWEATEKP